MPLHRRPAPPTSRALRVHLRRGVLAVLVTVHATQVRAVPP